MVSIMGHNAQRKHAEGRRVFAGKNMHHGGVADDAFCISIGNIEISVMGHLTSDGRFVKDFNI